MILCPLNITFLIWNSRLLSFLPPLRLVCMKERETEGNGQMGERGTGKDRWEKGLGEGGGVVTYRNLKSSVMVQGAQGELGRNCSRCGQVACWLGGHPLPTWGFWDLPKLFLMSWLSPSSY